MKITDFRLPTRLGDSPPRSALAEQGALRRSLVANSFRRAFTLIEMLVVIAIIGILAALIVGGLSRAGDRKVRSRVSTELKGLEAVIGSYHKKHGFYPPSNEKPIGGVVNTGTNQLFYELTGTKYDKAADTFTDIFRDTITSAALDGLLGAKGIVNAGESEQNFLPNLKPSGYAFIPNSAPPFRVLVVPYKGPGGDFNPWHYNSAKPVHNPDGFDLWAEVLIAGKTNIISNW
jgi:prepilin-type N-terminal cleavage/methylation domain-containing protein